ncbi:MAG: hypothetical protein ACREDI_01265, partial [Roseiarcus sp.]
MFSSVDEDTKPMGIVLPLCAAKFRPTSQKRPVDRATPDLNALIAGGYRRLAANAPLRCLSGGALSRHFHKWRGASGQHYVCSVFPVQAGAEFGGLPDFDGAVAIAVARDAKGQRRPLAVFDPCWREARFCGDLESVGSALRSGASEWHVHLLADGEQARKAVIRDITN